MKKMKNILLTLLLVALLLVGCGETTVDETDTTESNIIAETLETEPEVEEETEPVLTPSAYQISIEDVESILKANEMSWANGRSSAYNVIHGGHQMRVVHTERGTYAVVGKYFNDTIHGNSEFYFVKVDNEDNVTLLYYDEYISEASTMQMNIGQDTNGDVIGTVGTGVDLRTYIFDAETDAVEIYRAVPEFTSELYGKEFMYPAGYSQTMFDFANRKLYQFYMGCYKTNEYFLEWFTFDMETKEWTTNSICQIFSDILGRVNYLYPIPDGNGGAYVMGRTGVDLALIADEVGYEGSYEGSLNGKYAHDTMYLFHIPDMTSAENIAYTVVQEPYRERAHEGIWSEVSHEQRGHVFMDADGYLHIIYMFYLYDITGNSPELDKQLQYRHAIFDGMECIYNEKIEQIPSHADPSFSKFMLTQSLDGTLYMIETLQYPGGSPIVPTSMRVFKADDALGKSWTMAAEKNFENLAARSISISEYRAGSTKDNTVDILLYGNPENSGTSNYTLRLSLDDYSITEPVETLGSFDLILNETQYFYPYYSAHQNQVIHTENGTYAAFVYNYDHKYYNPYFSNLHFCITKTDADGKSTVLYDGVFVGDYEEFLNMQMLSDGKIYVTPPTGEFMYVVDPATDTVTEHEVNIAPVTGMQVQQISIVTDPVKGKDYAIAITGNGVNWEPRYSWLPASIRMDAKAMDTANLSFAKRAKMYMSDNVGGFYTNFYFFSDGSGGAYTVATRQIDPNYVEGLNFVGRTDNVKDSIALMYMEDLNKNNSLEPIDIQAPYADQAAEGVWSVVNMADEGDVYMDSEGKLHVIYSYYHVDLDDMDKPGNTELKANTFKRYHIVLESKTVVSKEEILINGLCETASLRMAETTDGTLYLLVCNTGETGAKIDVYFQNEGTWALTQTKTLGEFTAESFSISSPRGGSVQDNVIDCIVYASDNDVYFTNVSFK